MAAEPAFGARVAAAYDESRALPPAALAQLRLRLGAMAGIGPAARVLDVGAGTGLVAEPVRQIGCRYTGIDASCAMLREFVARQRGNEALVQADLRALPFGPGSFDAVLAFRVFGVVPGWRRGAAECLRVLKPGGCLLVGRVERPADSLHAQVRDLRNAWLVGHGLDVERPGASDEGIWDQLAATAESTEAGEPMRWTERVTPRAQIEASLSGWRVQALDIQFRTELRASLIAALAERFGDLDKPVDVPAALVLHVYRRLL